MADFRPKLSNQYRRAFDWRLSYGKRDSIDTGATAMTRLATSDFPDILEDFLEVSRKRKANWTALARLQTHMIEELLSQEGAVRHYQTKLKELQEGRTPATDDAEFTRETKFINRELFLYRLYANAVRGIGDGIAWRTLGYDRAVTRLMSERETKQWLTSDGLVQELREWSRHFETGTGIAILNALTNCLAIGDVTVVRPDDSVEVIEVKNSNTKSGRKVRQKQKMSEVVTILDKGSGQNQNRDVRIEVLPVTPETALDQIEVLLDVASREAMATKQISNCLYVEALDFVAMEDVEQLHAKADRLREAAVGEWQKRGDLVVDMNTLDILAFSPNAAPFSIFPFTARTCVELMIGSKFYITYLNLSAVAREFEYRGWTIERRPDQLRPEEIQESMMRAAKDGFHVNLAPADFMRLQVETLRPTTLIQAYDIIHKQGPIGPEQYLLPLFSGESEIWD